MTSGGGGDEGADTASISIASVVNHAGALVHPPRARYDALLSEYYAAATAETFNMENEL